MGYSHARSSSATSIARSKSCSPRRHATPLTTAPSIPQLTLSERETLARQRLQTTFETYVFNTLPTQLVRVTDMTLVTRNGMWETFKPRIESLSDSHIAKLLLKQDEEARKLVVSVADPEVLAPFVSSWFTSHCRGKGLCWGSRGSKVWADTRSCAAPVWRVGVPPEYAPLSQRTRQGKKTVLEERARVGDRGKRSG